MLIFYILIDQISIILILFSMEIIVSTLHSEPRKVLIEQEMGREGCLFYPAPIVRNSICCSLARPNKTAGLQKQKGFRHTHPAALLPALPALKRTGPGWLGPSCTQIQTCRGDRRPVQMDQGLHPVYWYVINPPESMKKTGLSSYL